MDFANIVSLNSVAKVEWNGYPLPGCRFAESRGSLEDRPKRRPERFPMKDSVLVAILADHSGKSLHSATETGYAPFFIAPTEGDPREAIKAFFSAKGLAVSVRPPYSKGFLDGAPLAFFRCRIQTGSPSGNGHPGSDFETWWKKESEGKELDFTKLP